MAENSPYFLAIIGNVSKKVDQDEALHGDALISLETQGEKEEAGILANIANNPAGSIRNLRFLSKEDQELLLSYYALGKTQESLAPIHWSTQRLTSSRLRAAVRKLCAFLLFGEFTAEAMRPVFEAEGWEDALDVPLSEVIELYARCRSYQRVAQLTGLRRQEIRRVTREAARGLKESKDMRAQALGAFLWGLVDKASTTGAGVTARQAAKQGHMYARTSQMYNEFRVDVTDPEFGEMFSGRAQIGRRSGAPA